MKIIKVLLVFLISTISIAQTDPHAMLRRMDRGINLGNVLQAPVEGNWAPAVTEQYFIDVANAGFGNIRVGMDFFGVRTSGNTSLYSSVAGTAGSYTGTASDYVVASWYLDRVEQVIDWGLNQGLVVILDMHGAELKEDFLYTFDASEAAYTNPTSAKRLADNQKFEAIWTQIAERFKNKSENLLFEVVNEPYFDVSTDDMIDINTYVIDAIRNTGSNNTTRNIIITGGTLTSYEAPTTIPTSLIESDDYLIATFHYYRPFNFTSSSRDGKDKFTWGSTSDKTTLRNEFDVVKNWADAEGIPVFLGEFGADNTQGYDYSTGDLRQIGSNATGYANGGPDNASRVEFHRYCAEQAINRGFAFAAWCAGPESNKTIHKRTDAPSTYNYDKDYFTVTSYVPKITTPSTVQDNSVWVEDVKDALFASGSWPLCSGVADAIIENPNFECGYNTSWSTFNNNGTNVVFTDAGAQASNSDGGGVGALLTVTNPAAYNNVVLRNIEYTGDVTGKTITVKVNAAALGAGQKFKMRFKADVDGTTTYTASPALDLLNGAFPTEPFEFEYEVADNTNYIQFQLMVGEFAGTYIFDDIDVQVSNSSLSIENFDRQLFSLYPNPAQNQVNIKTVKAINKIQVFSIIGQEMPVIRNGESIDISNLKKGIYSMHVVFKDGLSYNQKLIVE